MEQFTPQKREKITTVKVNESTKDRIEHLRVYKRESYDDIIQKILEVLNLTRVSPERARARLIMIDKERKRNFKIHTKTEINSKPTGGLLK